MQNGGFKIATDSSYKYIDAILWENCKSYESNVLDSDTKIIEEIKKLQKKSIKVFAVSNSDTNISKENLSNVQAFAEKLGLVYYHTTYNNYHTWPF